MIKDRSAQSLRIAQLPGRRWVCGSMLSDGHGRPCLQAWWRRVLRSCGTLMTAPGRSTRAACCSSPPRSQSPSWRWTHFGPREEAGGMCSPGERAVLVDACCVRGWDEHGEGDIDEKRPRSEGWDGGNVVRHVSLLLVVEV